MDRLLTIDAREVVWYLASVYHKMAQFTTKHDSVVEVCTRHDRGTISPSIVPHDMWTNIDRMASRPGLTLDVIDTVPPVCDVLLSTAILHHTERDDLPKLMGNLCASAKRLVMLYGPNVEVLPELFGDHEYHIDADEIRDLAHANGFHLRHYERVGLSEPLSELLLVFEHD